MTPRNAINFAKSPTGAILTFGLVFTIGYFLLSGFFPHRTTKQSKDASGAPAMTETNQQSVQSYENTNYSKAHAEPEKTDNLPKAINPLKIKQTNEPAKPDLLPISLYADTPTPEAKQLSSTYAPFGRLIPCELIVTVDSASIRTPIIGLVTEDIYHAGKLIIPAGTEAHGIAQLDHKRERISSGSHWTLVWQTGEELELSGIALDREKDPTGDGWAITDGSAGLKGRLIKSDSLAEIKMFAASFLSGAAGAFTDREFTIFGSQSAPTLNNAPMKGAQDVLTLYAKQIYDTIQREGFYVRVPAGKQFYLYVTQTIDEADASIGGTRFSKFDDESALTNRSASAFPPQYIPLQPSQPGIQP